jgi:peptidoglycan hydrolase-like protein with peptidoglycan-binding domain
VSLPTDTAMTRAAWVALLSAGRTPMVKVGSAGTAVRRLQRALNAAEGAGLKVTGVFATGTTDAVKAYQGSHGMVRTGVAGSGVWRRLQAGMH